MLRRYKYVIRLFTILFKKNLNELPSAFKIYEEAGKNFNIHGAQCPNCKTKGRSSYHDSYSRNLITYDGGDIQEALVSIRTAICKACDKTSALLSDIFVPHKTYSMIFILHVLKAYFFKKETVNALCARFGIATATLYAWKKRYLSHKKLNLGTLEKYFYDKDPHLINPNEICVTNLLYGFFSAFGFSFLQYSITTETGST